MLGLIRHRPISDDGVRFCGCYDCCAKVSTAALRADRYYDRVRAQSYPGALRAR